MSYPKNKIQCTITKLWFGVTPQVLAKRVEKSGRDEEYVRSTYVCQAARKYLDQGYSNEKIIEMIESERKRPSKKKAGSKIVAKKKEENINYRDMIFKPAPEVLQEIDPEIIEFLGLDMGSEFDEFDEF